MEFSELVGVACVLLSASFLVFSVTYSWIMWKMMSEGLKE